MANGRNRLILAIHILALAAVSGLLSNCSTGAVAVRDPIADDSLPAPAVRSMPDTPVMPAVTDVPSRQLPQQDSVLPLPDTLPAADTVGSHTVATPGDSAATDTLPSDRAGIDTLTRAMLDSLRFANISSDSLTAASDSTEKVREKDALDDPVAYESQDSMTWTRGGYASLYGQSKVNYQKIELTAAVIKMQVDSSIVYADGVQDTTGKWEGAPVFNDGSTPYNSNHLSYNFKTEKGYINEIVTQQGEGYMVSDQAKKGPDGEYYIEDGIYTTCDDHEDPHFNIRITRAKVRPGRDVVFGPAYLEVMGVPLPLFLPFGFFPFTESDYSSGLIMPSYGDEMQRGFYLKDGGYYFALSDYFDLKVLGEVFTKGSWGLSSEVRYNRRYHFTGNVYVSTLTTKLGDKGLPDYSVSKDFKVRWTHRQDSKANPNQNFSASVNFATQSYETSNLTSLYNPALTSQSTRTSSVSYSRNFPDLGLSLSSSMNLSQNMRDSTLSMSLPSLSLSLQRVYPFKKKKAAGSDKWYEKISFTYSGTLSNSINCKEKDFMSSNLLTDWRNGMKHSIPISATFQFLGNINITPSFNYNSRWYSYKVNQYWDDLKGTAVMDTVFGFNRVYDYNMSVSANTKLYGMYQPSDLWRRLFSNKLVMVRHVFTPTVSYSMTPDFGAGRYGYYQTYTYTDSDGEVRTMEYSPYQGALYGVPGKGKSGNVSLSIDNNLEMKVRTDNDSIKKVSLIDQFGASISYNLAAKTKPWSNLNTKLRIKFPKYNYTFNLNATWATYAYQFDKNGNVFVGDRTEWSYGRFGRFQGMSQNWSYTFNNNSLNDFRDKYYKIRGMFGGTDNPENGTPHDDGSGSLSGEQTDGGHTEGRPRSGEAGGSEGGGGSTDEDGYLKYTLPWSLSLSYGISMREDTRAQIDPDRMRYPWGFTHSLNISGNVKLTNKWNITYTSGWDFTYHDFTTTTMNISRDLHCFNMSCSVVLSPYVSYNFSVRANSSMLSDLLKLKKRSSQNNYVEWYDK